MIALIDLDGTLCNDLHRVELARAKQFEDYHKLCHLDAPYEMECALVRGWHCQGGRVMYLTGRNNFVRGMTVDWLQKHKLPMGAMFMRPDDCFDLAEVLKRSYVEAIVSQYGRPAFAMDDHAGCCEMYREFGIPTFQPRIQQYP